MKIKLKDLAEINNAFNRILSKEIPPKLSYRMVRITDKIIEAYKSIREMNDNLVRKHGNVVKDKDGNDTARMQVPPEKMKVYTDEYEAILETEVDLGAQLIPFECLNAMLAISPADMSAIKDFIEPPATDVR